MIKIKEYVMAESLEQAYELNQKKRNCIIGGMLWLKMGNRMVPTAIDLSNLGLNTIEENEEEFSIGCMTTLRQLEQHEGLNSYTNGAVSESVRSIVGVQFRNLATVFWHWIPGWNCTKAAASHLPNLSGRNRTGIFWCA